MGTLPSDVLTATCLRCLQSRGKGEEGGMEGGLVESFTPS
jgi:hypothetical protein